MDYRPRQNHLQQQNPPDSAPIKAQRLQEDDDEWWKSDGDEEEEDEEGSMAAKATRASSGARRHSSLSSAYATPPKPQPQPPPSLFQSQGQNRSVNGGIRASWMKDSIASAVPDSRDSAGSNPKPSFWSTIARKAKSIIEDEGDVPSQSQAQPPQTTVPQSHRVYSADGTQFTSKQFRSMENNGQNTQKSSDGTRRPKGLGAITSSLNYIGNALEEGLTIVENRTADIIQETRKLNVRKKFGSGEADRMGGNANRNAQTRSNLQPPAQSDLEIQLKASRDVSMAMAAKTKVLLRELKTVKADLAFAKERCAQLEDENRILRESLENGDNPEDDDLIRLQLESLLAEKARLAHENSVYARENRFLREIVEYRQLTMQDVVYLDENNEEVTEVYPANVPSLTKLPLVENIQPPPFSPPQHA